ncbi:nuclear transport factor 2 family protein [Halomonas faecis]|uniref:nuclear transport factor 2 family protein n=1 Tax=Halomonas faecis TaxID=1562110 RepID=UPI0013D2E3C2|nr:nuclear transport factor 2 family protein [Halomonas faecis]
MHHEDLKQVRENWYSAFFAGDVEHLARVQADDFTVTTERGVQSKKSQIDAISSAKRNGSWFPQGGYKNDTELTIQNFDSSTTVTGQGYTTSGQSQGPVVAFSETWEWDGAAWRVVSLSYSAARS